MKKFLVAIIVASLLAVGAACADDGIANPWYITDAQGVMDMVGVEFGVPEGAEDVAWFVLASERLAEMQFTWNGMEYTARIKFAGEFEDISGMYYTWDDEQPCKVSWCEGVTRRAADEGRTVELCLWFDVVPGIMYSLTTSGEDLDGFDILAAAEQVFVPMQGDA